VDEHDMAILVGSVRKIDNRDDRKEIRIALEKLSPEGRIKFLKWSLTLAPINIGSRGQNPLKATPHGDKGVNPFPWGSVEQVYFDLMMAMQQFAVPPDLVVKELEVRASKAFLSLSAAAAY